MKKEIREEILTALFCFITVALLAIAVITWNVIFAYIGLSNILFVVIGALIVRIIEGNIYE